MAKQVIIKILDNSSYVIGFMTTHCLRDTTVGKEYAATFYKAGETDSEGDHCDRDGVLFKDDAGDTVYSFDGYERWEVV